MYAKFNAGQTLKPIKISKFGHLSNYSIISTEFYRLVIFMKLKIMNFSLQILKYNICDIKLSKIFIINTLSFMSLEWNTKYFGEKHFLKMKVLFFSKSSSSVINIWISEIREREYILLTEGFNCRFHWDRNLAKMNFIINSWVSLSRVERFGIKAFDVLLKMKVNRTQAGISISFHYFLQMQYIVK